MSQRRRIAWRCRRGMKELDVLLEPFVANGLAQVPESELDDLERLLDTGDNILLDWLMGKEHSADVAIERQIERVRRARPQ